MVWTCFLVEPTDRVRRWLRRYARLGAGNDWTCAGGWHDARVQIEDGPRIVTARGTFTTEPDDWPRHDPRWPARCACGYAFAPDDTWQLFWHTIWRRPDTGEEMVLLGLPQTPVGAMWRAAWFEPQWAGPDGQCLCLMTPGGEWVIDGPAKGGGRWTRTGTPPRLTVTPSIGTPTYHGWLQDGVLTDDLDGRTAPAGGDTS